VEADDFRRDLFYRLRWRRWWYIRTDRFQHRYSQTYSPIKPQAQPGRYTIACMLIQQRRILAQHLYGAGFRTVIIHGDAVIMDNIEAHALQQLAVVPATAEQCSNGRQRENPERTTPGSLTRCQAPPFRQ